MKNLTLLCILTSIIFSCNSEKNLKADIDLMVALEDSVFRNYESNAELANLVEDSEELRELLTETFYNLGQMEEHSIAASGGYKNVEPLGDRRNILNSELRDAPSFIRNNPYNIDLNYLNRVSEYLNQHGFTIEPAFKKPSNEPELDYFDFAFSDKNIFQILSVFHQIKLEMLYQERQFLKSKLKDSNDRNDSL